MNAAGTGTLEEREGRAAARPSGLAAAPPSLPSSRGRSASFLLVFVAAPLVALVTGTSLHELLSTAGEADVGRRWWSGRGGAAGRLLAAHRRRAAAHLLARRTFPGSGWSRA